ncbi:ADP,ATP carrier protein [Monoraphidium neglectum]|uniref:ADP/ATP translocase n=1 Tax=Monoraphidium neglectum TaxID=145388 RepID=A0A0D2LEY2_9CHLO|nr:ADP,ATP carrier protein [Monoraphidium neglectum]KIZ05224.1 ADP,ATP carrier protein [Monoraphidium neglectum]|eukprot:XP_013904243.1 ADP,ATP carrier protein [Monoraphidium neglectum]
MASEDAGDGTAATSPGMAVGSQLAGGMSMASLMAGLLTSALYTSATYPVHRVKVLLQTQDANPAILSGKVKRYAFAQSFSRLLKEQGPAGLWRGNTPYLLRHVPSVALSFTFKDALRDALLPSTVGGLLFEG